MTKNNNDNTNALHGTVSILHAALEMRKHACASQREQNAFAKVAVFSLIRTAFVIVLCSFRIASFFSLFAVLLEFNV